MVEARCNCGWCGSVADIYSGRTLPCPACHGLVVPRDTIFNVSAPTAVPYGYKPYSSWPSRAFVPQLGGASALQNRRRDSIRWNPIPAAPFRNRPAQFALLGGLTAVFSGLLVIPAHGAGITACAALLAVSCALIGLHNARGRGLIGSGRVASSVGLACALVALFVIPQAPHPRRQRKPAGSVKIETCAPIQRLPLDQLPRLPLKPDAPKPAAKPVVPTAPDLEEGEEEF